MIDLKRFIPSIRLEDVLKIKQFLSDKNIGTFSIIECSYLWEFFSNTQCANWINVCDTSLEEFEYFLKND